LVRTPGQAFLATTPNPTSADFEKHPYWRKILRELRSAYRNVCAYSCHFVPYDVGTDTVEHYLPKVPHPQEAYEWSNFRFVCGRLNGRKHTFQDVLDPFQIENGWFVIEFPSLLVKPADQLKPAVAGAVQDSIDRLKLNDESTCLKQRSQYVSDFCELGQEFFDILLIRDAPFIAAEIVRQNLLTSLPTIMSVRRPAV
jgi:hypothetical protein